MKAMRFIGNTLLILIVVLFAIIAAISFFSAPEDDGLFGLKGYTVVSGSMEPTFSTGDFVFVQTTGIEDVREGDVVTFTRKDEVVTHRAVEVSDSGITTKGDANNIQDQGEVTKETYVGELFFILPYFGYVVVAAQKTIVLIGLGLLLGGYFIMIFMKSLKEDKEQAKGKAA